MATQTTPGGNIYDPLNGVKQDEQTALNRDARDLATEEVATSASKDATKALQTANAYADQIAQANTTAGSAVTIATDAKDTVESIEGPISTRLSAVETAAGYAPGDATDAAMTNIATQEDTQFRAALNAQMVDREQPDFVAAASRFSPYSTLEVHKTAADGTLEVVCRGETGGVTYQITGGGRYRFVGTVWEGNTTGPRFDPASNVVLDRGDIDARVAELTRTGAYVTPAGGSWYTEEVGATWETTLPVTERSELAVRAVRTNKGGLWKIEVPGLTSANLSTWNSTTDTPVQYSVITLPEAGTYTVKGTFLGADPAHAPDGGIARGYIGSDSGAFFLCAVPEGIAKTNVLSAGQSNKNYAIAMNSGGGDEFAPQHADLATETEMTAPRYLVGTTPLNVDAMAVGSYVTGDSFTIVQHIRGHNTYSPTVERLDIQTRDRIDADGTYTMDGTVRTLTELQGSSQIYTGMLVTSPQISDSIVSSFRTAIPATPELADGGQSFFPEPEWASATSVAAVGLPQPDLVAAVTFDTPKETRRANASDQTPRLYVNRRNTSLTKIYPDLGYDAADTIPMGTTWRYAARMWYGRSPGIRAAVMP